MVRRDRFRVLLIWPAEPSANLGVPQLLMLASALRRNADAEVEILDLGCERNLGPVDLPRLLAAGYDLVGISCYSSFDYLKVIAIAARVKQLLPRAILVTGGYHPSARPNDFEGDRSPFDFVIVGDGEAALCRLVQMLMRGQRPLNRALVPEPVASPSEFMPYDWTLLNRYRPLSTRFPAQAEIYLSRGCPFDCAFCMERAKRETSWRALAPLEAVEELHRLDRFFDLTRGTIFIADALFGMKRAWRREFLQALAARPLRAVRTWLLIRIDLIEREDLELMARAKVSPGVGLESGDPTQLRRIRKSLVVDGYLERMIEIAEWARELDLPFGANIIVGHPGETEASLRRSADYMRRLFGDSRGTHGFLSVDPFRLYPGSAIDQERARWETETGMVVHHYPWWQDPDQGFLAEWLDPSRELDYRRVLRLRYELFTPIVRQVESNFAYHGPAREYFLRSVRQQSALSRASEQLASIGLHHLWRYLDGTTSSAAVKVALESDQELAVVARAARRDQIDRGLTQRSDIASSIERVPRERFVPLEQVAHSASDHALPLLSDGSATNSALHAYARAFELLPLGPGDALVEFGAGSGYGSALAAELVGAAGRVIAVEVQPELAERARENLAAYPHVTVVSADATAGGTDGGFCKGAQRVLVSFAVPAVPEEWLSALCEGGVLLAPVGPAPQQTLTRFAKRGGAITRTEHGPVRFVTVTH